MAGIINTDSVKFTRKIKIFTPSPFRYKKPRQFCWFFNDFKPGTEGAKDGFSYTDMKLRVGNKRSRAMTFFEVMVIVACVFILAAIFLSLYPRPTTGLSRAPRIQCVSNIKQVNLAFRIWAEDNNNQYPMGISVTNGGAMELIETGNVAGVFQVMSNELSTTKILICPADPNRTFATNWNDLNSSHISYFIGVDVTNESNQMVLDGDDNFVVAGKPANSGLLDLSSNSPVAWSGKRHKYAGNLGLADGSVQEESQSGMQQTFQWSENGVPTNRIAIP